MRVRLRTLETSSQDSRTSRGKDEAVAAIEKERLEIELHHME